MAARYDRLQKTPVRRPLICDREPLEASGPISGEEEGLFVAKMSSARAAMSGDVGHFVRYVGGNR